MIPPMYFTYDGDALIPTHPLLADKHYVVGETYRMVEQHDRSQASHNHEFAWLHEAWQNLPEDWQQICPTPEHLRKRALIDAGFYNDQIIDAETDAAAMVTARIIGKREPFSVVFAHGPLVIVRTAKSQSRRKMDKQEFQASKQAILELISEVIGVAPEELLKAKAA